MAEAIVLVGRGAGMVTLPEAEWWSSVQAHMPGARQRFDGLPPLLRAVRRAAVILVTRTGRPVPPQTVAAEVRAPIPEVVAALDDLERRLFFLVRDDRGDVAWAFPMTAVATPHHLTFPSGERRYGA
ncbi:MAG: hypothetical protein ACM3PC_07890 [Deltaproteobacteria bacterium]